MGDRAGGIGAIELAHKLVGSVVQIVLVQPEIPVAVGSISVVQHSTLRTVRE